MICVEESCAPGEADDGAPGDKPLMRLTLGAGTGGGYVPAGEVKPYNRIANTPFADWIDTRDENYDVDDPKHYPNQAYCADNGYDAAKWEDCYAALTRGVQISSGIAWSKVHIRLNAMFYITDRILLGATFRGGFPLEPHKAVPVITPLGLASFAFKAVGKPKGLYELDLLVGFGGGIIMHKIKYEDCRPVEWDDSHPWTAAAERSAGVCEDTYVNPNDGSQTFQNIDEYNEWVGPEDDLPVAVVPDGTNHWQSTYFRKAGYFAAEFGVDQFFWFHKNVGLNLGVVFDVLLLDSFAFHADVQLGVAARF
jgi:hypothetical protein